MKNILSVKNLRVDYNTANGVVHALCGVSFTVAKGEIFGIVGESGSGKTTICKALIGLAGKSAHISGEIVLNGRDILNLQQKDLRKIYGKEMALLPQSIASLNPLLTIGTHIEETIRAHFKIKSKKLLKEKAVNLLRTLKLADGKRVYRSFPYQLSGGMNQRVLMAVAFCCFPLLLIADEPTTGLDHELQNSLLETIIDLKHDRGISMLFVTHDLKAVENICDKIAVMYNGLFVETGNTKDVLSMPGHPYTRSLIKAMPENGMCPTWGFAPGLFEQNNGCAFQPRCPIGKDCFETDKPLSPVMVGRGHYVWCCNAAKG